MGVSRDGNNRLNEKPKGDWLRDQWSSGTGGKGSRRRRLDAAKFAEGYERVFGSCSTHPKYGATAKPTSDCVVCRRLWREAELRRADGDGGAEDRPLGGGRGEPPQGSESTVAGVVPPPLPEEGRT